MTGRTGGDRAGGCKRPARVAGFALVCALGLLVFAAAGPAAASTPEPGADHVFDATLSLTGSETATSKADPVPDPPPAHPSEPFFETCGVAVDSQGDVYVASYGHGAEGQIDVFDAAGRFLTEIEDEHGPCDLAVDSAGNVYVIHAAFPQEVVRYAPSEYPPSASTTYAEPAVVDSTIPYGVAVNPANDRLLVVHAGAVAEFSSAATGNTLLKSNIGEGRLSNAHGIAVDAAGEIFVGSVAEGRPPIPTAEEPFVSVVYIFDSSGAPIGEVDGSETPEGGFASPFGRLYPALDEATGELFVADGIGSQRVYRYLETGTGEYEYRADPELESHSYSSKEPIRLAVSNTTAANADYVFATSPNEPISHLFAFGPEPETGPPVVSETAASGITATEAILSAEVLPHGFATSYSFQYIDEAHYLAEGFAGAAEAPAKPAPIGAGNLAVPVSQAVSGLQPGTAYRFRVLAENCSEANPTDCVAEGEESGGEEVTHRFATYPPSPAQPPCPNAALRVGRSAALPDCRAYELVSPAQSGGHKVFAGAIGALGFGGGFPSALARADGESAVFESALGPMPATATGNGYIDQYRAQRSAAGWIPAYESPTGAQMQVPSAGGLSADQGYSFWRTGGGKGTPDSGSLVLGAETQYLRSPDGAFHLLGSGSEGTDPEAQGRWIAPGGAHAIFTTAVHLEAGAPPEGIEGIYDRTADGQLHVLSLLPGGEAPAAGATVKYQGASADGATVAFTVAEGGLTTLYLRVDDSETIPVKTGATVYGGLSADGGRLTYLKAGNVFSFDVAARTSAPVGSGGESTIVNVSADGSHVYFVSPQVLVLGGGPEPGGENLYVWDEAGGEVSFVAVLTSADVEGQAVPVGSRVHGLGLWTDAVSPFATSSSGPGNDPSRASADGRYLLFESHADLTDYEAAGAREVYRYDAASGQLLCLSCNPTLAPSGPGAQLQSLLADPADGEAPINSFAVVDNLGAGAQTAFFESDEALVPADSNSARDVYEWEASGVGGCARAGGCISLISGGRGSQPSYLYGVGAGGRDVFFVSAEALVPGADGGSPALYDARVNGGFPAAAQPGGCGLGDCQAEAAAPFLAAPAGAAGSVRAGKPSSRCAALAGRVRGLSRRARRLRRQARRIARRPAGRRAARRMNRKASRLAHRARGIGKHARRCRARGRSSR